jgi:hypothetical protein
MKFAQKKSFMAYKQNKDKFQDRLGRGRER